MASRGRWALYLLALLPVALAAPPAEAVCGGVKRFHTHRDVGPGRPPLAIGDSVMFGAGKQLAAEGFDVNVRGCRQMSEGLRVLKKRRRAHTLPEVVVVALGANWMIEPSEIRAALRIVGAQRTLGLVTPREDGGGSGSDARVIRAAGRHYRGRVRVFDWVAYSRGHRGWFGGDGLHLGPAGARGLAHLLRGAFKLITPLQDRWSRLGGSPSGDSLAGAPAP
jgi:hypothetical protein